MSAGYAPYVADGLEVGQDRNGVAIEVGDRVRWTHGGAIGQVEQVFPETNDVRVWVRGHDRLYDWACEQVEVNR